MSIEENKQETGLEIFNQIQNQKALVTADNIKELILTGEANPTHVAVTLKRFAKIQEIIHNNKQLQEVITEDVKKYIEKGSTAHAFGAKITVANYGYNDWSQTQDPVRDKLLEIQEQVKEQLKAREEEIIASSNAFLKKKDKGLSIASYKITFDSLPKFEWEEIEGEVSTNPVTKNSKEGLRFTV